MKIKKALAVILASATVFSMAPGTVWAAEEIPEVTADEAEVSELEEPETDIEEIQDESDNMDAETTEKQLENNEVLESASLFSDAEDSTVAVGVSGNIVASGTDPWNKDVKWILYDDGELVFDGSGTMEDYTESKLPAWYQYREKITSLVVNDGIQNIGHYTFYDLYKLKSAKIGSGCSKLGGHVFEKCTNLVSVELPEEMTSIGDYTFTDCSSLTDVDIPEKISIIGYQSFRGCSSLKKVIIPDKVTSIKWNAFQNCSSLEEINIPDGVTEILESAFSGCSSLKKIDIPESVTNVDRNAFQGCNSLESIEFPGSLTNMGWNTISGCENLKCVKFADGFRSIAPFNGCPKLTEIIIPDTVTAIGNITNCMSLESIYIPEGVNYVGSFGGCSKLRSVRYAGSVTSWNALKASVGNAKVYYNYNPNHEHSYELTVMTPNTCTTNGTGEEICSLCGAYYKEIIPASHTWDEGKVTKEATCEVAGEKAYTCSVCNTTKIEKIEATGHIWNAGEVTIKPTCTETGEKTYTCKVCNATEVETVEATGHQNIEIRNTKEATCSEAGYTGDRICKDCDTVIEKGTAIAKKEHSWDEGEVTTPATCTEKGVKTYTCTGCKETRTEEIPATGHQHTEIENAKEATCSEAGYTGDRICKDCDTVIEKGTTIAKKGHTWNAGEVTTPATCTAKGEKTYACTVCNATKAEVIPAAGHNEVTDATVEPTCTEAGKTEGKHCSVCNKVLVTQTEIPATGHQNIETINAKEATCSEAGYTGDRICKDCDTVIEKGTVIAKKEHDWNDGKVTTPATCTARGEKTYTCTVCKETRTEEIPATGHTEVTDKEVAPTCTTEGKTEGKHCSVCNEMLVTQTVIPATGHQNTEIRNAKEATCSNEGYTGDKVCKDCDTTIEEGKTIAPTGHTWNAGEVTTPATCTEAGVRTDTCTVCNATKTESIKATGHTEVTDSAIEPTCETIGKTEGSHCSVCNEILVPQKTLEATGHTWGQGKVTKAAICTETGEKTYTCSNCNKTRTEELPVTDHKFRTWTTRSQATVDSPEIQVRSCDICKKEEQREVGNKLQPTISVNASKLPLKMKQKTKVLKVTGLAAGDSIASWKSSNTKIVKVSGKTNGTCTLTAGKKTGKAKITITLKSGLKKDVTITVQKGTVKTSKVTVLPKTLNLQKKQKVTLQPALTPLTSQQKITYKSGNSKVATVNSKGIITAKKKGTAVITVKSGSKTVKCKVIVK